MVRHYDDAVDADSAPVVVKAMMQYLRTNGFRQDQVILCAEGQEDGFALNL
jgi:hypothetical protein